jgi:hypothetical protein
MSAGEIIVAYTDYTGNTADGQVKAVLITYSSSTTGGKAWPQSPVTVTPLADTSQPSVSVNASGAFVIAFTDTVSTFHATAEHVLVQQFQVSGGKRGAAIAIGGGSQIVDQPSTALAANGAFVVAYDFQGGVDVDLYSAQGAYVTTDTVWQSSKTGQSAYDPSAAIDATGNFVVGYTVGPNGNPQSTVMPSVWGSAYDSTGKLL